MKIAIDQTQISFSGHMLLETLADGMVMAWVSQIPDCRVMAASREEAIVSLELAYSKRLQSLEILPLPNPVPPSSIENPWTSSYGILQDDSEFQEWHTRFWKEKQVSHDDDPILSIEDCIQVM